MKVTKYQFYRLYRCARHDGGVQAGEGNSLTDEDNDNSNFDVDLRGMNLNVTNINCIDLKVTKITTWLQAAARGSLARLQYLKLR